MLCLTQVSWRGGNEKCKAQGILRLPVRLALIGSIKFGAIIDFCLGGDSLPTVQGTGGASRESQLIFRRSSGLEPGGDSPVGEGIS